MREKDKNKHVAICEAAYILFTMMGLLKHQYPK